MRQLIAFSKKEFLEQLRTSRLIVLTILFCLFGIMNPAIAKMTPWMMSLLSEQLTESGMILGDVEINALTSWTQFFKNMPMALIVFIVMFSSIITAEFQNGTLINVITKGLSRWKILTAKMMVMVILWTLGYLVSFGITFGYNAYFWDNSIAGNIFLAAFCFYLMGLWLITVILPASILFHSASAVTLSVGIVFFAAWLPGLIPKIETCTPAHLMASASLMANSSSNNYGIAMSMALVFIIFNILFSIILFNRKNI